MTEIMNKKHEIYIAKVFYDIKYNHSLSLSIVCVDTFLSFNQHVFCGSSYISIKEKAVIFKTACGYR